jgi:hypothetical protein
VKKSPNDHVKSPKKSPEQFFVKNTANTLFNGVYNVFYTDMKWLWIYSLSFKHLKLRQSCGTFFFNSGMRERGLEKSEPGQWKGEWLGVLCR